MLTPRNINARLDFTASGWRNYETEKVARNIVLQQRATNLDMWTPFSVADYVKFVQRVLEPGEANIIEALAEGGQVWNISATKLQAGYLTVDAKGRYMVTEMFIEALPPAVVTPVAA